MFVGWKRERKRKGKGEGVSELFDEKTREEEQNLVEKTNAHKVRDERRLLLPRPLVLGEHPDATEPAPGGVR